MNNKLTKESYEAKEKELKLLLEEKKISQEEYDKKSTDNFKVYTAAILGVLDDRQASRDELEEARLCTEIIKDGDEAKGLNELVKLHESGQNGQAGMVLASIYYQGQLGVEKNHQLALKFYESSADDHNNDLSQLALSLMHLKGEGGLKVNIIKAYYYADLAVKNNNGDKAIKLKQSIEESLTPQQLLAAREVSKLTNDVKKLDDDIFKLFQGKDDEPEDLDESQLEEMNGFEIKDHFRETFRNDTYHPDDYEVFKDFDELNSLDQFVQYRCVQKLKKLTISPHYFLKSYEEEPFITDIAPLAKIENLEELFFGQEDSDFMQIDYYSSVQFPNINKLIVSAIYDCRFLLNFPNIESLTLEFCFFHGDNYKPPKQVNLSFMKNLKTLELLNCPYKVADDKVELDHLIDGISLLENLEKLVIYVFNDYSENFTFNFKHLTSQSLKNLNKLETVVVMGEFYMDASFALEIPNLKTLVLDNNIELVNKTELEGVSFKTIYGDKDKYTSKLEHETDL